MSEPTVQPGGEPVPYDLLIPELEGALHRATSETVILRARLAARNRELAALRENPQPPPHLPAASWQPQDGDEQR